MINKKIAILTCAKKLFLEQGYKNTSIQTIADEAGISKGAVYLYFNSKDDILFAIFRMLEDKVWAKIDTINKNNTLTPREKYRQQLITFYNEINENLQFNQMMMSESGIELNEAFYGYAREYRFKLQKAQEKSLLAIYGETIHPWLTDIVVAINGIIQEFDASIIFDNLSLESEQLADFVCDMTDFIVKGMTKKKPTPLFDDSNRQLREQFLQEIADQKSQAVQITVNEISELVSQLELEKKEFETVEETVALLNDAVSSTSINHTLVKALIVNLKPYKKLRKKVTQLMQQLDIN